MLKNGYFTAAKQTVTVRKEKRNYKQGRKTKVSLWKSLILTCQHICHCPTALRGVCVTGSSSVKPGMCAEHNVQSSSHNDSFSLHHIQ